MAIVAVFEGITKDQYEETVRRLAGKDSLDSTSDWPVAGILSHAAGEGPNGFRVVDVWESEESFGRFGQQLIPILRDLGVDGEPEIYPAHTYVSG